MFIESLARFLAPKDTKKVSCTILEERGVITLTLFINGLPYVIPCNPKTKTTTNIDITLPATQQELLESLIN